MKPTFRAQPIHVQVPATSANLGPGFDSLGLALTMYDRYVAQIQDEPGIDIDVAGEGALEVPRNEKNLVIKAMYKGFDFLGGKPRGIALRALNVIPHGRGLGSSASAIVGGLLLSRGLVLGGSERMTDEDMLNLATEMEGHPDNVAAAIYGNANIAWQDLIEVKKKAHSVNIQVDTRITATAFIPATPVATSKARKMLPDSISHSDAVKNSTNSALLVYALQQRPDLLLNATADYLHQFYRQAAMPQSFALLTQLRERGIAAFISGAGPTVLALQIAGTTQFEDLQSIAGEEFTTTELGIDLSGATIISA